MFELSVKRAPPVGGAPVHSLDVRVGPPGLRSLPRRFASPSQASLASRARLWAGTPPTSSNEGPTLEPGEGSAGLARRLMIWIPAIYPSGGRMPPVSTSGTSQTLALWRSAPRKVGQDVRAFREASSLADCQTNRCDDDGRAESPADCWLAPARFRSRGGYWRRCPAASGRHDGRPDCRH